MTGVQCLRILGGAGLTMFLLVGFTPLVNLLTYWMTPHRPTERVEAIVVMGRGGVATDGTLSETSLGALVDAIALYRSGFAPVVVFSGPAAEGRVTEAEARAHFARQCGIPTSAIFTANRGRTTHEEAVEIGALLRARGIQRILLVADGQGMGRVSMVFERLGFFVVPEPSSQVLDLGGAPQDRLSLMRSVGIELAARMYYRIAGYL